MANPEHVSKLKEGINSWNQWRRERLFGAAAGNSIDLSGADFSGCDLREGNFDDVNFTKAVLENAMFTGASFQNANLSHARLANAHLKEVNLRFANLSLADLSYASLITADLTGVNLVMSNLVGVNLYGAQLDGAKVKAAHFGLSALNNLDLSEVSGLEDAKHFYPSTISVDTLYRSKGKIPEGFLRGCGVPEDFIAYIPSFAGSVQAIQFYSCFISYSTRDEEFARRLHSRLREAKLRVWFAPEDMKGGRKIHEQIENAIQVHDRLLLVLSKTSMQSEWVMTEVRRVLKTEKKENRRKLFPIRLINYDQLKDWELVDNDSGKDLAAEIRSYFIPDFSDWKNHDAFEIAFAKLLQDLKTEEGYSEVKPG